MACDGAVALSRARKFLVKAFGSLPFRDCVPRRASSLRHRGLRRAIFSQYVRRPGARRAGQCVIQKVLLFQTVQNRRRGSPPRLLQINIWRVLCRPFAPAVTAICATPDISAEPAIARRAGRATPPRLEFAGLYCLLLGRPGQGDLGRHSRIPAVGHDRVRIPLRTCLSARCSERCADDREDWSSAPDAPEGRAPIFPPCSVSMILLSALGREDTRLLACEIGSMSREACRYG